MCFLSPTTLEHIFIRETYLNQQYYLKVQQVGWVVRYPIHSLHSLLEIQVSYFSTYYGQNMNPMKMNFMLCGGYFSTVLLEIFKHPYPTLVRHYKSLLPNQVPNQSFCFSMGLQPHKIFQSIVFIRPSHLGLKKEKKLRETLDEHRKSNSNCSYGACRN